jgi:hypothetical protein
MIIESKINPTDKQKELIEWILTERSFPLFFLFNEPNQAPAFMHFLRKRNKDKLDVEGDVNSEFCEEFEQIFKDWAEQNSVEWNKILRTSINFTTHQPPGSYAIHQDHHFPHKNWLVYLNEFTGGDTTFYKKLGDMNYKEIYYTNPKKYGVVMSDGEPHDAGFCAPHEIRVVMVVTFN